MIRLLGAVRVQRDDEERLLSGAQPKMVLVHLGLERDCPVSADELGAALWPDEHAEYSAGALRGVVSKVRSFLHSTLGDRAEVENLGGCYRFVHADDVAVDVVDAAAEVHRAERLFADGSVDLAAGPALRAVELLRPNLLPGMDREWLGQRRTEITRLRRRALCLAARIDTELGAVEDAVELAAGAVLLDPFDEASQRTLIAAHLRAGDRSGALRAYEACRRLLSEELGVAPSSETESLRALALQSG